MRLTLHRLDIPFRQSFAHASAVRRRTESVIVVARDNDLAGHGEGCPRAYVTGETVATAKAFFETHHRALERHVCDLETLREWMSLHRALLDRNPAAWCAVELALLDLFARRRGWTVERLLGLPALCGGFRYSAVIGIESAESFAHIVERYRRSGFRDFKLKLSGDSAVDRERLATLRALPDARVRVDANNRWQTSVEAIAYLRALGGAIFGIEEPLAAGDWNGLAAIGDALNTRIILDESCTRPETLAHLRDDPERWIVNVRVSKMGGVLRALDFVEHANRAGIAVIVGAQVGETSLLTRAALTVATVARPQLLAQEGAFGEHLIERDPFSPVLTFGARGVLPAAIVPNAAGWGLTPCAVPGGNPHA